MVGTAIKFTFGAGVSMPEARETLELARLAAVSLYGVDRVDLEARVNTGADGHSFTLDTTTAVGRSFALIFSGYARREFGLHAVSVEHLCRQIVNAPEEAHT